MKTALLLILSLIITHAFSAEDSKIKWSSIEMNTAVLDPVSLKEFIITNANIDIQELPIALNAVIGFELKPYVKGLKKIAKQQGDSALNEELSLLVSEAKRFFGTSEGQDLLYQATHLSVEDLAELQGVSAYKQHQEHI